MTVGFLKTINRWIRVNARGNKPGVDAQFSIEGEKLAFSVNEIWKKRILR